MLQINKLTINHLKDLRILIKDFSLTLNDGDKAAIIGEEGNGKSTLLKLIYDDNLVENYIQYSGEIIKKGLKIGYLAQELDIDKKRLSVYEYCSLNDIFFNLLPNELAVIAKRLGIKNELFYSEQIMDSLSGGEKVKVQIACILMEEPDILLLDEPSNDLDIETIEWLQEFINSCKVPVLYISHDEILLENTANMIIHIEQLKRKTESKITIEHLGYSEFVETRLRLLKHQEQIARKERSDYEKQQEKFRQIQQKVEHQQNVISRGDPHGGKLLKKKMHSIKSQQRRFEKEFENFTEIPETEEAMFVKFSEKTKMPNGKRVLNYENSLLKVKDKVLAEDIKLEIFGPRKVCIIGKNGVGKSTMLKEIASEMLKRKDINAYYMPQNYEDSLDLEKTPVEFLTCIGDKEENSKICTYLASMKYTRNEMFHKIGELSGGQKAKLLFLKMTMGNYDVLLLDEPTRNFSPLSNPVIINILQEFKGTIISVSHDRKYIKEVCDTVYELTKQGLNEINNDEFN